MVSLGDISRTITEEGDRGLGESMTQCVILFIKNHRKLLDQTKVLSSPQQTRGKR